MSKGKLAVYTAATGVTFGALAATHASGAETTRIEGYDNIFQVAADSVGTVPITNWNRPPGFPSNVAYPELELREFHQPGGAFDQRVFLRVDLSSVPSGAIVTDARLNLFWLDTYDTGAHSDWVDLWGVPDRVEDGANFNTSNGSTPWTDGLQAGVDGYLRTGPSHLGFLWHSAGGAPAGTPSKHILDLVQEYKEFVSDGGALETYLTGQLVGSQEANFQLSIGNDSGLWQRFIAASDDGTFWVDATGNPIFGNQPFLDVTYVPAGSGIWNQDNDGTWSLVDNWQYNVPNAPGAEAVFGGVITQPRSILVDSPHTVGGITFDNVNRYSVGGSMITLDTLSGNASVTVLQGSHDISAPLQLDQDTTFSIAPGSTLAVTADMTSSGIALTKIGDGALQVTNVRATALTIDAGSVSIAPNGTPAGTSRVNTLALAGGATPTTTLDLANNAMVVDYSGTSPLEMLVDQIRAGAQTGTGIVSSQGANYGVGYAEATDLSGVPAIFGSVDGDAVLLRGTRFGDANLDGLVNLNDFNALAANFGQSGRAWNDGDFNYDALVNLSDFNRLAANFGLSAAGPEVTPQDWANLAAAVPEPGAVGTLGLGALLPLMRRSRRVHRG